MLKTCCFATSVFSSSGLDFGASWASKSAALLAAPGVLNPTAFYACINILHFLTRGWEKIPKWRSKPAMLALCWCTFRPWAFFFRCSARLANFFCIFGASWQFFWFLATPGIDFGGLRASPGKGLEVRDHISLGLGLLLCSITLARRGC